LVDKLIVDSGVKLITETHKYLHLSSFSFVGVLKSVYLKAEEKEKR